MPYALISVFDKRGLDMLGPGLINLGFQILSSGGTAKFLRELGVAVQEISDFTGFPEILDGRVKSLHPKIHAGILAKRSEPSHRQVLHQLKIPWIDLVVVNLYPFEQEPTIENIDIGGPSLVRAAAKNYEWVTVVSGPEEYPKLLEELKRNDGNTTKEFRKALAKKVFATTARYEAQIARWIGGIPLRYGENAHQRAFFLPGENAEPFWNPPIQGKELSYNNILDADQAWWLIREFKEEPFACAIVKHTNPCGVAISQRSLKEAFEKALQCDPQSAFGGIVIFNREVDGDTASDLAKIFLEVVLAPGFSKEALEILSAKKNVRLLPMQFAGPPKELIRSAGGGTLYQDPDILKGDPAKWEVKTNRRPTEEEMKMLQFAWKVVKHVNSNAIVFATGDRTLGIGAGQTSRVEAVRIAIQKAKQNFGPGTFVCASEAFFPFPDSIEEIAKAGATAVIQPGGSVKDFEVIEAANAHSLAMVFTGVRHFRH